MGEIDLSGAWQVRHDPLSQGLADRWWRNPPDDGWREISVPSAWQSVLGADAHGLAWYRRRLPAEALAWARGGGRVRLRFDRVATEARVWIGSRYCGGHEGDWVPFELDITDALLGAEDPAPWLYTRVDQYHAPRPARGVVVENGHIAKGFHDVLSLQHAGLWGAVRLRRSAAACLRPNGLGVQADLKRRSVTIELELTGEGPLPEGSFELLDPDGAVVARDRLSASSGNRGAAILGATLALAAAPAPWSPESPALYTLRVRLGGGDTAETPVRRVGFRTIETGGPGNSQILLNGRPLQIRGLLDWGHEPRHIAPAPTPEEVRANFAQMRARGFNCVALCMFYPPEHFFDIADETGMLVWQVHPVWKSRMSAALMPEYRRQYEEFFRRDRCHPSVVIVSGTCEHEAYDEALGRWWWMESGRALPHTLRQLQTGFLEQVPADLTHLHDDHVYDNCGRWVCFHEDMQSRIAELPPRPFVMGETIISNAWPDLDGLRAVGGASPPWWLTRGLEECAAFEQALERRAGGEGVARFKRQGERFAREFRKFQAEVLRMHPRNAGFVTNAIRDVPICRLGFKDDLDRWRFAPEDTRSWLGDVVLLLQTPEHLRGVAAQSRVACRLGVSNYAGRALDAKPSLALDGRPLNAPALSAGMGEIAWTDVAFDAPACVEGAPRLFELVAVADISNRWPLVALPPRRPPDGAARLDGLPFTEAERTPDFEERAYSSGWCLACRSWKPRLPDAAGLLPGAAVVAAGRTIPPEVRVLLTHRLTQEVHAFIAGGGRVVLLAHRGAGGMGTRWINLWGQVPLIVERDEPHAAIRPGESDAVLALLHYDLTRWTTRAVPSDDLADFADHVEPIIRYVWTHDQGVPKRFDAAFSARVEHGLLVVSCLDHTAAAGGWLLDRLLHLAAEAPLGGAARELDVSRFVMTG